MNAFVAVPVRVPASATQIATGRAISSVTTTIADRRPAVDEQAVERQQRAEDDEDAELHDLDDVLAARRYVGPRMSGRRMPSTIAATNTAMTPLPCGGSVVTP